MLFYVALILLLVYFVDYTNASIKIKYILIFSILLNYLFLAGWRYQFAGGGDWFIYKEYFERAPKFPNFSNLVIMNFAFEPGFLIFSSLVKIFTDDGIVFFVVIEFLSLMLLYFSVKEYTKYKIATLVLYYPFLFLSLDLIAIRSLLVVQIFLYSIRFVVEKKIIKYGFFMLLASTIHYSAIVLLLLYFIFNKTYSNKIIISTIFIGFLLFIIRIDLLSPIFGLFPSKKITEYAEAEVEGGRFFSVIHIEFLIFMSLFMKFKDKLMSMNPKYFNIFFNMFFFYGILIFYFFGITSFSGRLKFFFLPALLFITPYLMEISIGKKGDIIGYLMICLYVIVVIFYQFYIRDTGVDFLNYKNYFLTFVPYSNVNMKY